MTEKTMYNYLEEPLASYLEKTAQKLACPGGGSVVALTAALSSALVSMTANFTVGKKAYAAHEAEIRDLLAANETLRRALERMIEEDSEIYEKIRNAQTSEPARGPEYLKESARLHMRIAAHMREVLRMNEVLCERGNKHLISDVGISAVLAQAAFYGARLNAEINFKYLPDKAFAEAERENLAEIEKDVKLLGDQIYRKVLAILTQ